MRQLLLIFTLLFTRNLYKGLFYIDIVPIASILILLWITIKQKDQISKINTRLLALTLAIPVFCLTGFYALSQTISLNSTESITRVLYNGISLVLTFSAIYKLCRSNNYNYNIKYSHLILILILAGSAFQFIFPFFDKTTNFWLFNPNSFALRGFSNESGILCQNIILLLIIEERLNRITKLKRLIYVFTAILTKSSLIIIIPLFYIIKAVKSTKKLIYAVIIALFFSVISVTTNLFSISEKISLFARGGGPSDLGGRYVGNFLISQNIINPTSYIQALFGNGSGSYQNILEGYLQSLRVIPDSFISEIPYDYGGSDFLIIINDFGLIGLIFFIILVLYLINKKNIFVGKENNQYLLLSSRISVILLMTKGLGLYSPFALPLLMICFI